MAQFDLFGTREPTVGEKIKSFFKNDKEPLEKKAIMAHYRIKTAIGRVRSYIDRLSQKDRELFERVVEALMKRDEARAKMYAKEVSEIRKISKQLLMVEYVLEHAAIKLETFMIFGGAITELKPVLAVMKQAVGVLRSVMDRPTVRYEGARGITRCRNSGYEHTVRRRPRQRGEKDIRRSKSSSRAEDEGEVCRATKTTQCRSRGRRESWGGIPLKVL